MSSRRVVFLTSEAVPLAKTGGLADVCGALPVSLAQMGLDVRLIMPAYRTVEQSGLPMEHTLESFAIDFFRQPTPARSESANRLVGGRVLRTHLGPQTDRPVPVDLIDQPMYYDRDGIYGPPGGAFADNAERFLFFMRAAIVTMMRPETPGGNGSLRGQGAAVPPAIVHCHDWQSALVPALIRSHPQTAKFFADTKFVLTVHNLAYQGTFPADAFPLTGLGWDHFRYESFEYFGGMNFLKTGIVSADHITTVSSRYAEEIQTETFGCGLNEILSYRKNDLSGIVNGIDPEIWDPATDQHLVKNYSVDDYVQGKLSNRSAVHQSLGLPDLATGNEPEQVGNEHPPLVGLVGRLAEQKGWDLILPVIRNFAERNEPVQWAILGSGDSRYETELRKLAEEFPQSVGIHIGFDEGLAHRIEAASDVFLMPSQYEPCGLNQLYSLLYGSIPVVTPVGGLADTVVNTTEQTLANKTATGFWIESPSVDSVEATLHRAFAIRKENPSHWSGLVRSGMTQDWTWKSSAEKYLALYGELAPVKLV